MGYAQPNFIIIFTDDQGYEDLGVYGSPLIKTPNIDQLAADGVRFTDFYVTSSVCSPSRASLLTGQTPAIHGVTGVYWPGEVGMNPSVLTIAEVLKTKGYTTGAFGKWHLGDQDHTRPTGQGFDEYYGIPYSNDMFLHFSHTAASDIQFNFGYTQKKFEADKTFVKKHIKNRQKIRQHLKYASPVFNGNQVVEYPADQALTTHKYFEHAKNFIERQKKSPFFVYITPSMPHVPLFASEKFRGQSKRGLYGDTIEEIDYEVGELRAFLKLNGLEKDTVIMFSSDNGPWLKFGDHGGSAGLLRDGKMSNFEGGVRVPAIFAWPGTFAKSSVSTQMASTLDIFPTIIDLADVTLPAGHKLHGQSIADHLKAPNTKIDRDRHYYTLRGKIAGVRAGNWKYLRANMSAKTRDNNLSFPVLFNLKVDIQEKENLAEKMPSKLAELEKMVSEYEQNFK